MEKAAEDVYKRQILSSHILSEVQLLADKVGIISGGILGYEGALKQGDNLEDVYKRQRGYLGEQKTRIGGGGLRPGRLWIRVEGAARAASVETVWKGMSEMEEVVLCGASAYNKKFYLNEDFKGLPEQIKNERCV